MKPWKKENVGMKENKKRYVTILLGCFLLLYILPKAVFACCIPPNSCTPTCQACTGEVCVTDNDGADCEGTECKKCSGGECVYRSGNDCEENSDCDNCDICDDCFCTDSCDPDYCESCIDDTCKVCGGDTNQACCDGTCYNTTTQKCCDGLGPSDDDYICDKDDEACCDGICCDYSTKQCCDDIGGYNDGYCCPSDEICCNGLCCEPYQCCIDGQCVDPMCDNCHSVSDTVYECGHRPGDTECATNWCIKNVLNSATCDHKGDDWPCTKSNCNTSTVSPHEDEITQYEIAYLGPGSCPGGTVNFVPWKTLYYGCTTCSSFTWKISCETSSCSGSIEYTFERGDKKECGGCGY